MVRKRMVSTVMSLMMAAAVLTTVPVQLLKENNN